MCKGCSHSDGPGPRTPAESSESDLTLLPEEAIIEPIMGPVLPFNEANFHEIQERLSSVISALKQRHVATHSAIKQYLELNNTIHDAIETLCPVLADTHRNQIRKCMSSLSSNSTKTKIHLSNSLSRVGKATDLFKQLVDIETMNTMSPQQKQVLFTEWQREVAVAVSEEVSAGICLRLGADEVEPVLELLGRLLGEVEGRRVGKESERAGGDCRRG